MIIFNNNSIGYVLDTDASKVIEAVRSTGVTITPAMMHYAHYLISNMKNIGTWQLSNAVYGFVGGTAASHKFNWKDLRDVDAAFRLIFIGAGWVHSSTGSKPDGTVYANTFLNPSTSLIPNSTHISMYSGTNVTTDIFNMSSASLDGNLLNLYANYNGEIYNSQYNGGNGRIRSAETRGDGYFLINRFSVNSNSTYRNGLLKGFSNSSTSIGSLPNANILLGSFTEIATNNRGLKQYRFSTIGAGLTDTQSIQQSQIVTNAQSILNRL